MKYCLIFGSPRSGTTFLSKSIGSLSSVESKIGQLIPLSMYHIINQNINENIYRSICTIFKSNVDTYLSGEYNSRFRALGNWWRAPLQLRRLYDVVRRGPRPRPDYFLYKEPFLSLRPEFALDACPEAKLIYIYRDGRDVANSLVETYNVLTDQELTHLRSAEMRFGRPYDERYVPWWVDEGRDDEFIERPPYVRAIWMWAYMVRRCARYFQNLETSNQVLKVQYETFMHNPHSVGDRILHHLGKSDTWAFRRQLNRARTSSIGKHTQRPQSEIDAAVDLANDELKHLGYV